LSKPFHQDSPWRKLSKDFKTLKCVDCGKSEDIEAGHILPASKWKMARLWRSNLVAQCRSCNAKLGDKIRWSIQALKLILVYGMIKAIYWTGIILYFSLTTSVMVMDLRSGGMETSFTGQILIQSKERIYEAGINFINFAEQSHAERH